MCVCVFKHICFKIYIYDLVYVLVKVDGFLCFASAVVIFVYIFLGLFHSGHNTYILLIVNKKYSYNKLSYIKKRVFSGALRKEMYCVTYFFCRSHYTHVHANMRTKFAVVVVYIKMYVQNGEI